MPEGPGPEGDLRARCVALEKAYVHEVYKQLSANNNNLGNAPRLLANVTSFLSELEPGSVVADVGCGPGRYLSCRPDVAMIGVDACWGMTELCRSRSGQNALCADNLKLPLRDEAFDAVISIAVIHHFASKERRIEALKELARITRIGGRVLITVWAMEQDSNRRFESQDILVPYRQPSICTACHHSSHGNNYVQTALLNSLSNTHCGANGGCCCHNKLSKQLRRSCAVSYSTATSEDDCQSERDFSIYTKPRLRRWAFTRGRSLEDSYSSDQSSPSDTCYSFVRRAVQRLSSASSSESRRSYFHKICRRPWLTDSTDSGTGINVSLSSAERMSESPDLFEEEAPSERHDVSKSESFDSDDFYDDDGFIELRNLDPESPEEQGQQTGENPKDRVSPLLNPSGLKHKSRSLGDMFGMIPSLLLRSRRRRSARNVDLQKRASTVSDPREYLLRSKDKSFVSRSSSTTSEGFMRFDYFRFLEELSPEGSLNGNSSPTPIHEEKHESAEENEPLLRTSDEEVPQPTIINPIIPWWNRKKEVAEVLYEAEESMTQLSVEPTDSSETDIEDAQHAVGTSTDRMVAGGTSARPDSQDSTGPRPNKEYLQLDNSSPPPFSHQLRGHVPPHQQVASIQVQAPHVDLASRRRLKFQGTRLQEKALRNQFSKKSSFDKLLRKRTLAAKGYFSMPNLNVFSAAFNERSPASHLRVLLKRPPAPDLTELELKLGIIDEHGNLRNPLRSIEHRGSFSSLAPIRMPAKRSLSIETSGTGSYSGFLSATPSRPMFNRRYSLSAVQGNSGSFVPGIPSRSWVSKARHDSLKSDTSVESESDSVVSVIYRSKVSGSGSAGSNGGGLSDNSIDSEESIVSVIHRSTEDTPRAGSANGSANGSRSWQASPLTISQTNSREGSFSSPEYSPTLKSAPLKPEKVSCKLWETSLQEVEGENTPERGHTPQPPISSDLRDEQPHDEESRLQKQPSNEKQEEEEETAFEDDTEEQEEDFFDENKQKIEQKLDVKASSPPRSPSSSSDDAPYMSDEEVQCEDIPESFELESAETTKQQIDQNRLQPPSTRRICSPVEPLDIDDDSILESIPEEDESCSPIKSPRSNKQMDTHFPMPPLPEPNSPANFLRVTSGLTTGHTSTDQSSISPQSESSSDPSKSPQRSSDEKQQKSDSSGESGRSKETGGNKNLHPNVPEPHTKSSANSSCCCTSSSTSSSSSSSSTNCLGGNGSPLRPFKVLPPSRLHQQAGASGGDRRASDVGPQSKCPKDRAKFSPQYSLPEQNKKCQKELTASCEQLFRRRLSPQRQQQQPQQQLETRNDPLNDLLRGPKPKSSLESLSLHEDQRGRSNVSPEHLGSPSSSSHGLTPRRRTPDLTRTSPLEMLAQELRSSTDDMYRRATASDSSLSVEQQIERRNSPERKRTPDYLRMSPDPRFEDAPEDGSSGTKPPLEYNYWDDWLPQALSRIYAAKTNYDCDELCDQLTELPDFVPQNSRYVGGRICADGDIFYSDRDSPEDMCLIQDSFLGFQSVSVCTPPTSPEQFSDADESTASTTDQEISDLSSSLERLRVSCGLQPEMSSGAQPLNIVIEDFSDHGGSDAEISEACSSNAASNVHQLYVQERQGGSSSLSDHSDRSSASVQTVYKLETPSKDLSPEAPPDIDNELGNLETEETKQEKLSLTSSSSDDSSDENFGENCCANMSGHSAETYHRFYHVFRQGELDSLIEKYVHSLHILKSYYDHSNWCIVAERVQVWTI